MTSHELADCSAIELATMIHERKVSPVEATRFFLERIERIDLRLSTFVTVTADRAMQAARQVMTGDPAPLGPSHGVPIPIKERSIA